MEPSALEGDRPGAHPVDVLGELPIDGESLAEEQLMPDADLDPDAVEGDRFDVDDDDLGMQPDLETEPDAPDLRPTTVERFAEAEAEGELATEELEDQLTARPSRRDDEYVEPVVTPELP